MFKTQNFLQDESRTSFESGRHTVDPIQKIIMNIAWTFLKIPIH